MHDDREEITDTLELAQRINSSTDVVTDQEHTIDAQQQTIDRTITQAAEDVIAAFEHLTPGLVPIIEKIDQSTGEIMVGITGLAQKIDNIDFSPVEEKLEDIEDELMQGVTGLNQAVDEIKELVSGVTGYAQQETLVQGVSSIVSRIDAVESDIQQGLTGLVNELQSSEEEILQGLSGLREEVGQGFSGVEEKIDQGFTGITQKIDQTSVTIIEQVHGVTGYALDATVAKESTVAKQGSNANATNTAILTAIGNINVESADQVARFFGLPESLPEYSDTITEEEIIEELENIMSVIDPDFDMVVPSDDSSDDSFDEI